MVRVYAGVGLHYSPHMGSLVYIKEGFNAD